MMMLKDSQVDNQKYAYPFLSYQTELDMSMTKLIHLVIKCFTFMMIMIDVCTTLENMSIFGSTAGLVLV